MTVRRLYNTQMVLDADLPCAAPTETIFINRIKPRGFLGRIEATHDPGLIKRMWNGMLR